MPKDKTAYAGMRHLSQSLLLGCAAFILLLGTTLGLFGYQSLEQGLISHDQVYLADILNLTISHVDADDLATCIETLEPSPTYRKLQAYLDSVHEAYHIDGIYIVYPRKTEDQIDLLDVIAGTSSFERYFETDQLTRLGKLTGSPYPAEVTEHYLSRMEASDEVTFFTNTTAFGHLYTGVRSIVDSQGEPVAVLAVDRTLDDIDANLRDFTIRHAIVTVGACIIALIVLQLWLRNRVVGPLESTKESMRLLVRSAKTLHDPQDLVVERPDIHTHDEFESLANSLVLTSETLRTTMARTLASAQEDSAVKGLAFRDPLTGTRNKIAFDHYRADLDKSLVNPDFTFGIALFSVCDQEALRERYDQDKADLHLQNSCRLICDVFRHSPVYRIDGDTFLAVLEGRDLDSVDALIERLRIECDLTASGEPWEHLSVAVGYARFTSSSDACTDDVTKRAESMMLEDRRLMRRAGSDR